MFDISFYMPACFWCVRMWEIAANLIDKTMVNTEGMMSRHFAKSVFWTCFPAREAQNSPSWSGDHLVVIQKFKQLPESPHTRVPLDKLRKSRSNSLSAISTHVHMIQRMVHTWCIHNLYIYPGSLGPFLKWPFGKDPFRATTYISPLCCYNISILYIVL